MAEEQIRKQIAELIEHHVKAMRANPTEPDYQGKVSLAMDILSIKGIRIEAENQELPKGLIAGLYIPNLEEYAYGKDALLIPNSEENVWVKCLKKEEQ